jgi:hypothetical protein
MELTTAERIATLESEIKHLTKDVEEVKAIAQANQKTMRWGMGAAAAIGAMLPLIAPKLAEALGIG